MQQAFDPATGAPSQAAGVDDGLWFGMPWWLVLIGAVLLLWMLREPLRRLLWQVFFITGRMFGRWGVWLLDHGRKARATCNDKIAAQRADELQDQMLMLEDRIGARAQKLPKEVGPIVARLDKASHALDGAAANVADINLEDAAERAFRAAMPSIEAGRNLSKLERNIAQNTAKAMQERLLPIRPALSALKVEAPRLKENSDKLSRIHQEFDQDAEKVNAAFTEFEAIVKSDDRQAVAARASILIPWLIAVLITSIALSGVFLNFFLIERPMAEIVGEGARIGGIGLPTFAALIVIFLEFVAGVVLMDSAGFTKLIPAFQSMSLRARRIMFWVAFSFLAAFSVLEATLAIVREQIIEQQQETRDLANRALTPALVPAAPAPDASAPAAAGPAAAEDSARDRGLQLATIAQLILAVLIPWLLAAAALPLESIIRNTVFMVSIATSYIMMFLAFACKTIAVALKNIGLFALTLYDLVIFVPYWIERRVKAALRNRAGEAGRSGGGDADDIMTLDRKAPQKPPKEPRRERNREPELEQA